MTTVELLTKVRSLDVKVWIEGEQLRYRAAKGVLTPELRAELVANKEQILGILRTAAAIENSSSAPPIEPADRAGELPLSFAQQRLWFLDQLEPGSPLYNIPLAVQLNGALDPSALNRAFEDLICRHEGLRTCFQEHNGEPVQVILPPAPIKLEVEDITGRVELQRLLSEEAEQPFDLAHGPLLRVRLFRLSTEEHVLAVTMHHIISDEWSMGIMTRELSALYDAYCSGSESLLPELRLQYADYAVWQREWLQGEVLEQELRYWRKQLAGAPAVIEMPLDHARPAVQTHHGAYQRVQFGAATTRALKELTRRHNATLFMTVLAGFQALLSRWSGTTDVVVGTPVAGRTQGETEAVIGFFVNTLALRTDLTGNPSFSELVSRVREVCLAAYAHQEVPFEKLVEELGVERDLSRTPLFQVMLAWQNGTDEELAMSGLRMGRVEEDLSHSLAKFDLLLSLGEFGEEIGGTLEYNVDLYDAKTIERLARQLERVMAAVAEAEECRVGELPLLSEAEREQLLVEWNGREQQVAGSVVAHFEREVERRPEAVALQYHDEEVSYAELNQRANQLAHYLREQGVGPEALVGVMLERSVELVVSLLAILKAGGAYVPLDAEYPAERLAFMIEDARLQLLLTTEKLSSVAPRTEARVICLDREREVIASQDRENPQVISEPDDLAYVMYTSGSTGSPKGVAVPQRAVIRLVKETEYVRFGPYEVFLQLAPVSFDASTLELWGSLLNGARLVIMPPQTPSLEELGTAIRHHSVTTLWLTAGLFHLMVDEQLEDLTGVRQLLAGGDVLSVAHVQRYLATADHGVLINGYGPTENTTFSCTHRMEAGSELASSSVPIGRPITNTQVYVLDQRLEPAPVGVVGELYLGGAGLAREYLRRPELTAEKFVPHPYSNEPGARLYRTGDLVRWLADGTLEFVGRIDQQVKLRGFRVELGEIESVLNEHEAVRESAVLARMDQPGERRLAAYVVTTDAGQTIDKAELRSYLRERLPEYMVPSAYVQLESLPLTANGKVDRRALPAPDHAGESRAQYEAPRTPLQEILCGIWAEVLRTKQVGIRDNFFELGGDSIRSVRVVALARAQGLQFSLQQLFQHQTIEELAPVVRESGPQVEQRSEPFSLVRAEDREKFGPEIEDAYPLSLLQAGMLFHSEYERESALYHVYSSYHVRAPYDEAALREAFRRLVRRHAVLRTSFDLTSYSEPLQLVQRSVTAPLAIADIRELSAAEQEAVIAEWQEAEKQRYIDWREAPLVRFQVHRRSEETSQFSFALHHAILDGWSVAAMLTELFESYLELLDGGESQSGPPSSTFRDFVALEQAALQSEECKQYWKEKLSGSSAMSLPGRHAASEEETRELHLLEVPVPLEVSVGLKQAAEQAGVPVKSVLLAAHLRVMSVLGGQPDVLTGVVSHGRPEAIDVERALGLYLNTLPFRIQLSGGSWLELIKETFAIEREMLPYRYYPMAQIKIDAGGRTLFDTSFNFVSFHIYQSFEQPDGIEVIDEFDFGRTDFTFSADFDLNTSNSQISLTLSGKGEALSREQIEAIAGYYSAALNAIAANPQARYELQALLSDAERERLLVESNDTRADYDLDTGVQMLFEAQVERAPNAIAVTHEDEHLSYAQLNKHANQIAHYLQANGIGPDDRVAVCLERSPQMIAALLGVLKAGAAYIPLDPNHPLERIRYILADSKASLLITQQHLRASLISDARVLCLDSDGEAIATQPGANPCSASSGKNLAYIIYTSGSTGQPKGVMIQHESLADYVKSATEIYEITSLDRVLQFCSINFDAHVEEIFCCLLEGGAVVLRTDEMLLSADEFLATCDRQGVTLISLPTAYWHALTAEASAREWDRIKTLRLVAIGGESALPARVDSFVAGQGQHVRLMNTYGPTETTVIATMGEIVPGTTFAEIGIGKPVANTEVYVLDENLLPVPEGVAGELHIGGNGVARGYLDRPDLTAEHFIPNPFSVDEGQLLYRTGDKVRYLPNGNLQFLNRVDDQVKIRGNRIEIGEIEARLRQHERVRDAVVVAARDERQGDRRLVAYIVAGDETGGDAALFQSLRVFLLERLPDYMIPAAWVRLDELPLTPNGKLDRNALPDPGEPTSYAGENFVAPRTMLEEVLASIWRRVLNLERISRESNFFMLGGHSLLATQIVSRIRESFQVELPLRGLFETPVLSELAERIEALLKAGANTPAPPLQLAESSEQLPLSFAQQRLWFLDQLMPGSNAYNLPAEMSLDVDLKVGALEQALHEVMRRHEALRTTFVLTGGTPVQKINPAQQARVSLVDVSSLSETERAAECERLRQEDWLRPFDLAVGPLLRATLIRLGEANYLFLLNMHHIISDGWSMGVLLQEMETLYAAFSQGLPSPLPELEIQYSDYARWQRNWLQGDVLKNEVEYWRDKLHGAPTLLELETDHPRPALRTLRGAHYPVAFSEPLSQALKDFSRQEGATLFMTVMAGFHALLKRHTGQNDVLIGTPIAGRSRVELEPLIGFFVNMIPIRTSFGSDPTFRELVRQVRESSFAAYTHQELPFDKLVEELQPKRAPGRNPIFQAILALNNEAPEMEIAKVNIPAGVPVSADVKFDLEVHLFDGPNGLTGTFVYSPELFDVSLISRMVDHFQRLFEKALAAPDKELSAISLLDEAEYRQIVETWNDTTAELPDHLCIHEIVEQEAARRPDAIAIESGSENITYAQLNRRANRIARRLREQGVRPEEFIGVMLERSADLVVAIVATLKAGAVYVPINLSDPPMRVRFVIENAGIKTILTSDSIAASVAEKDLTTVCVDADDPGSDILEVNDTLSHPDNLAYLMYTSGSTGTPKGVGITHRNVAALVKNANYARFNSDEVFLQLAPASFDASTFEIWACLLNGARLVIYPSGTPSLSELGEFVSRTQVTTLFLTTGLFHQFVDTNVKGIGAVKQLLTGGDVLSPVHLNKAVDQIDDCLFVNCYGPTEATVMACAYQVGPNRPATSVPIGRPISNSRVYIVNGMQPAGVGERGELFIGGAGLGRGYHNRPDLTAERFVPDPYGPVPGARLYRTGDAARYLNQGLIQFLGRVDNQVKISGFRIEPGEIEMALCTHPDVTSALVLAREDTPGDKRLVAYVVAGSQPAPAPDDLRNYLRERVPEYMVPSAVMILDELPLTLHGKIDQNALPAPQFVSRSGREYVAPHNDLQQQLVDIWEELFKLHPIGITDNFFELGGHSLMMIMLVARIEERLGRRVAMAALFTDPTIEHLAELIGHGKEALFESLVVPMQPEGSGPAFFSPHASGGNLWCYKDLVQHIGLEQPFYGIQARTPETGLVVHTEIEAMAGEYIKAIRSVQPAGPYFLGGWSMGGVIAFEMAQQLQAEGETIGLLALIDTPAPTGEQSDHNWAMLLSTFALDLGVTSENLRPLLEKISAFPQMTQLRKVWAEVKSSGLIPSDMTLVEFRKIFDIFKVNANTMESYRPREYRGKLTLFTAEEENTLDLWILRSTPAEKSESGATGKNATTRLRELGKSAQSLLQRDSQEDWHLVPPKDPLRGWGKWVTTEDIDLHVVPGDHFSMMREPHVTVLAEQLRQVIETIALELQAVTTP
ncbi:MAG TPA: amino acid adenylation domain-containing protein [Pyrinomonadaceae bacterium]|nr:amino acid adenylation domain-containing protein [Pyrinomonadaceae bacterium]